MKLLALLLLLTASLQAGTPDFSEFERAVEAQLKSRQIPGAAAAVITDGKIVYAKGFGVTSVEDPHPITPDTLFRLGSTSKLVTALACLKLEQQGVLDLTVPISKYLTGLPPKLGAVTATQLLNHTAGLHDDAPMNGPHDESALAANVRSWTDEQMILADPGRFFSYANTGYVLLGYLIQQLTGKPFSEAARLLVLEPAQIPRATFQPMLAITRPLALPHQPGPAVMRPFPDHAGSWPPGSLFASATDLARLAAAGIEVRGRLAALAATVPVTGQKYAGGLFFTGEDEAFHALGGRAGYGSFFTCAPMKNTCAVSITNLTSTVLRQFTEGLLRIALETPAKPAPSRPKPESTPVDSAAATPYIGRYFNGTAIRTELALRDGALCVQAPGGRWIVIRRTGQNLFIAPGAGPLEEFSFSMGPDGAAEYLHAGAWTVRRIPERTTTKP